MLSTPSPFLRGGGKGFGGEQPGRMPSRRIQSAFATTDSSSVFSGGDLLGVFFRKGTVMPSWFRKVGLFRTERGSFRQPPRTLPALERLEDRCLPAGAPPIPPPPLPPGTPVLSHHQAGAAHRAFNWNNRR